MTPHRRPLVTAAFLLVLVSCSGDDPVITDTTVVVEAPAPSPTSSPPPSQTPTTGDLDDAPDVSWVATAEVPLVEVFDDPTGEDPSHVLENPTVVDGPLVFLVQRDEGEWLQVLLPVRPNGSTGWVKRESVSLSYHQYRVEVTLAAFELEVFHEGESVFTTTVGVARDNAPTPGGRYYLTELIVPIDDDSPYGPFAYGLSGFSETFESFNGGPGQLGIHGTNDPASIGTQASSGCVRLANDDISHLATFLPLGTPVEIFT